MEFIKSSKVSFNRDAELTCGFRVKIYTPEYKRLLNDGCNIREWCNENIGKHHWNSRGYCIKWNIISGTKYKYYLFNNKENAMKFKLVWG